MFVDKPTHPSLPMYFSVTAELMHKNQSEGRFCRNMNEKKKLLLYQINPFKSSTYSYFLGMIPKFYNFCFTDVVLACCPTSLALGNISGAKFLKHPACIVFQSAV